MSADNGVYILKTKDDQIRVVYSQAINGIFDPCGKYISKQIYRHFGNSEYTKNMEKAVKIAQNIRSKLSVCEYGIQILPDCNRTWEEIINDSKET